MGNGAVMAGRKVLTLPAFGRAKLLKFDFASYAPGDYSPEMVTVILRPWA